MALLGHAKWMCFFKQLKLPAQTWSLNLAEAAGVKETTYLVQGEGVGDLRMQSAAPSQWSSASWPRNNPGVICAGSSCLASQAKERCQAN